MSENEKFEAWYSPKYGTPLKLGDSDQYSSNHAQGMWQSWQAALAASGGNAAPGLTDEQIGEIADNYKFKDHYRSNAEAIEFARKCIAASAPNAALVAALEALEEVGALEDGLLGDDPKTLKAQKMARAALSAAGQEVGK